MGGGGGCGVGCVFFFQAEDGIRDLVRSRGLGDVYKRQDPDVLAGRPLQPRLSPGRHPAADEVAEARRRQAAQRSLSLIHI